MEWSNRALEDGDGSGVEGASSLTPPAATAHQGSRPLAAATYANMVIGYLDHLLSAMPK